MIVNGQKTKLVELHGTTNTYVVVVLTHLYVALVLIEVHVSMYNSSGIVTNACDNSNVSTDSSIFSVLIFVIL